MVREPFLLVLKAIAQCEFLMLELYFWMLKGSQSQIQSFTLLSLEVRKGGSPPPQDEIAAGLRKSLQSL